MPGTRTQVERETVERLRVALGITSRYLRATDAGEGLTPTELSILATITRRGSLRLTELAEIERVNPTMLSRIAGRLVEARADQPRGRRRRPPRGARRGDGRGHRAARAHPRRAQREPRGASRRAVRRRRARAARSAAGARGAGRGPAPRRARSARRSPHVSPGAIGRRTFAALANPNYRRWYAGQGVSLVGTWMQTIAQGWLVYTLTGSGTQLGLVVALQMVPVLILAPYAGADRRPHGQAAPDHRGAGRDGRARADPRRADRDGPGAAVAGLRAGRGARRRDGVRQPDAAGVRDRARRRRSTCATPSRSTPCS